MRERVILVCGSRTWSYGRAVYDMLNVEEPTVVVHGDCPIGADAYAAGWCNLHDVPQRRYPADWRTHGRAAGPIRNQQMLDAEQPDLVLAFRSRGTSRGTDDMIRRAKRAGVPVRVIHEEQ